jgi:hypothetical protein
MGRIQGLDDTALSLALLYPRLRRRWTYIEMGTTTENSGQSSGTEKLRRKD